ncbi:MAG TPA: hypothetical protein VK667_13845, partial [Ktedonobacteraceae bacterium]|nr:hypothetical protein [Ktedonobacteraceae bacterium]
HIRLRTFALLFHLLTPRTWIKEAAVDSEVSTTTRTAYFCGCALFHRMTIFIASGAMSIPVHLLGISSFDYPLLIMVCKQWMG